MTIFKDRQTEIVLLECLKILVSHQVKIVQHDRTKLKRSIHFYREDIDRSQLSSRSQDIFSRSYTKIVRRSSFFSRIRSIQTQSLVENKLLSICQGVKNTNVIINNVFFYSFSFIMMQKLAPNHLACTINHINLFFINSIFLI